DGGDPDEASLDARHPALSIRACRQWYQCRLVDEPRRYCHADDITSGSARSSKTVANSARSATLTVAGTRAASCARRRRRYSLRETPRRAAWASSAASTSSGTSRTKTSAKEPPLISPDIILAPT